jgi:uncharacterized protein YgiM (DUF1202 family)
MRKKKKDVTSWRNDKKSIYAFLGDNKKYLMPSLLVVAVVVTIVVAVSANRRETDLAQNVAPVTEASVFEVPEAAMEENAYPEVNALVEQYYTASAAGDSETLSRIYRGLDETEILKSVAASEYIDKFDNITVYTKPGPLEGSYVAYVYNEVKLYEYDKNVPGLETLYICTDPTGTLYINGDIADANELDYLKQINVQGDVIDLNNKVASSYNEMVSADEELAELLTRMRSGLQVSVGEALATSESTESGEEASDEASEETSEESNTTTIVKRTIKATDVVNIRSSDSETADILSKTTVGQEFKEIEALANGWSKVEYNNGVAYVKTEFFEVISEEKVVVENPQTEETGDETGTDDNNDAASTDTSTSTDTNTSTTVSTAKTGKMEVTDSVRLRKEQNTTSEVLSMIYSGSTVNVIEQYSNGWAKVEYNKNTGYIKSEFLKAD